jgi:hypothetical protein
MSAMGLKPNSGLALCTGWLSGLTRTVLIFVLLLAAVGALQSQTNVVDAPKAQTSVTRASVSESKETSRKKASKEKAKEKAKDKTAAASRRGEQQSRGVRFEADGRFFFDKNCWRKR